MVFLSSEVDSFVIVDTFIETPIFVWGQLTIMDSISCDTLIFCFLIYFPLTARNRYTVPNYQQNSGFSWDLFFVTMGALGISLFNNIESPSAFWMVNVHQLNNTEKLSI